MNSVKSVKPINITPIVQKNSYKKPFIYQPQPCQKCEKLLTISHATMKLGQRTLWQDVNFDINTGEFVLLVGANGTGKTTLFQSILGLNRLTSGRIDISSNTKIGYVPQLKNFDPKLPIRGRDLVRFGLDGGNYLFGMFSPKKIFGKHFLSFKQKKYLVDKAIDEVGGHDFADVPLHLLSGGEQQRMRIAQALVAEPDLLLMDEPLLSLDVASQYVVADILSHRQQFHSTAILMISHELQPIVPLTNKVIAIKDNNVNVGDVSLLRAYLS